MMKLVYTAALHVQMFLKWWEKMEPWLDVHNQSHSKTVIGKAYFVFLLFTSYCNHQKHLDFLFKSNHNDLYFICIFMIQCYFIIFHWYLTLHLKANSLSLTDTHISIYLYNYIYMYIQCWRKWEHNDSVASIKVYIAVQTPVILLTTYSNPLQIWRVPSSFFLNWRMKGELIEWQPLSNAFRCRLWYVTFPRNVNRDESIFYILITKYKTL